MYHHHRRKHPDIDFVLAELESEEGNSIKVSNRDSVEKLEIEKPLIKKRKNKRSESVQKPKKSYQNERPKYSTPLPPKPDVSHNFKVGDAVFHSAFKDGVIIKLTPMGGDSLIEIEFESGVKRLMLKAAAEHMKKK